MSKTACEKKSAKQLKKDKFSCKNCGLSAKKEKHLCDPKKVKKK